SLPSVIIGLTALAAPLSAAVSLASFIPRIDILSSQCSTVYNAQIGGCVADDFKPAATCSAACVQGLVKIEEAVKKNCADIDVGETSIIGVFQNGIGIQALCPGVTVTTLSSSTSTTKATSQTSTTQAAATTVTTSNSQTDAAKSSSASTGGLTLDPSATATLATLTVSAAPSSSGAPGASSTGNNLSAQPSQLRNSQLSNSDSGGGSPFDVVATGSSSQLRIVDISMATLLATALLFI
ncbi:hypothetical protein BKA66DRAFT_400666, partial [Pyrenochaeta sp. MPI-SDFR-AT-0127]